MWCAGGSTEWTSLLIIECGHVFPDWIVFRTSLLRFKGQNKIRYSWIRTASAGYELYPGSSCPDMNCIWGALYGYELYPRKSCWVWIVSVVLLPYINCNRGALAWYELYPGRYTQLTEWKHDFYVNGRRNMQNAVYIFFLSTVYAV